MGILITVSSPQNNLAMRETVYRKMFQNVPCSMSDLSWKFYYEFIYAFHRIVANRHEFPPQNNRKKHSWIQGVKCNIPKIPDCSLCRVRPNQRISWKSVLPYFRYVTERHINKPTGAKILRSSFGRGNTLYERCHNLTHGSVSVPYI